jgi:oligopeptide/dipeptide ABC transporter ATP-binding protein
MSAPLLEVEDLVVRFPSRKNLFGRAREWVHAVEGVSFTLARGETLAVVGESGSGKTTVARAIARIAEPRSGAIRVVGTDILRLRGRALRRFRRTVQMVFQDPYASLDPLQTVGQIIAQPLRVHRLADRAGRARRVAELLELVNLDPAVADRYPHEFSGGQRQRIGIARALAAQPELIVADEPVSALDVSVQAQVIELLRDAQRRLGVSYVFIAHDLAIVRYLATRVMVMYLGRVMEIGTVGDVYGDPRHPYTRALLSAVPEVDPPPGARRIVLEGDLPSPLDPPPGCVFAGRCPLRRQLGDPEICVTARPVLSEMPGEGHRAACHFTDSAPDDSAPENKEDDAPRLHQQ